MTAPPVTAPPATAAPSAVTEPEPGHLDDVFDEIASSGFDGVIGVRAGADLTIRAFGLADRENDVEADAETLFDIGSLTKQFTAAAILRLEMDGALSVDDTVGQHVPGLTGPTASVTLHQLLTHTSGVLNAFGPDDEPIDRGAFLALVSATPLVTEPGEQFGYSNVGYALLAAVIEFASGISYEEYLRSVLFEPAGMLDTGYVVPDWTGRDIAVGYIDPDGARFGRPTEQNWDVDGPYWNLLGNGGLLSTAGDMLRWDAALLGDDVLDAEARAKFVEPHVPQSDDGEIRHAYGWVIVPTPMGTPLITHNGSNGVFNADFYRFVEQDVAVFMVTNSAEDTDIDAADLVADHLLGGVLSAAEDAGDDGGEEVAEGGVDAETAVVDRCGFEGLTIDSLPDHPELGSLPDSPAGETFEAFLELLDGGDASARLDFAVDRAADEFSGGDPDAVADGLAGLQELFTGFDAVRIQEENDLRYHVLMEGPSAEFLISLGFDDADSGRVVCLAVSP